MSEKGPEAEVTTAQREQSAPATAGVAAGPVPAALTASALGRAGQLDPSTRAAVFGTLQRTHSNRSLARVARAQTTSGRVLAREPKSEGFTLDPSNPGAAAGGAAAPIASVVEMYTKVKGAISEPDLDKVALEVIQSLGFNDDYQSLKGKYMAAGDKAVKDLGLDAGGATVMKLADSVGGSAMYAASKFLKQAGGAKAASIGASFMGADKAASGLASEAMLAFAAVQRASELLLSKPDLMAKRLMTEPYHLKQHLNPLTAALNGSAMVKLLPMVMNLKDQAEKFQKEGATISGTLALGKKDSMKGQFTIKPDGTAIFKGGAKIAGITASATATTGGKEGTKFTAKVGTKDFTADVTISGEDLILSANAVALLKGGKAGSITGSTGQNKKGEQESKLAAVFTPSKALEARFDANLVGTTLQSAKADIKYDDKKGLKFGLSVDAVLGPSEKAAIKAYFGFKDDKEIVDFFAEYAGKFEKGKVSEQELHSTLRVVAKKVYVEAEVALRASGSDISGTAKASLAYKNGDIDFGLYAATTIGGLGKPTSYEGGVKLGVGKSVIFGLGTKTGLNSVGAGSGNVTGAAGNGVFFTISVLTN